MKHSNPFLTQDMARQFEVFCFLIIGIAALLICLIVFMSFPMLDMQTTHAFYDADKGFIYNQFPWLNLVRRFIYFALVAFYVVAIIGGLHAWKTLTPVIGFSWDKWFYLMASTLLGPVMLVNVTLKGNWGRARPRDIADFGNATNQYTDFWRIADECSTNCSFTSGEVAGIAMLMISLALLVGRRMKIAVLFLGGMICAITAWLRIAIGAHFLSDTIMAVILMTITACLIYYWYYLRENKWLKKLEAKSPAYIA